MYRNVLVPLDGSNFSLAALPIAISLAERTEGAVQLATSVPTLPPVVPSAGNEGPVRGWFEEERLRASEFLEKTKAALRESGATVAIHTKVLEGDPADSLNERIRKTDVDLVVMTTHGRGPFQRAWLGSVADGLPRQAPCPILLWRPEEDRDDATKTSGEARVDLKARPSFGVIVAPFDGSEASDAMLPEAIAMARTFGARLHLMRVVVDGVRFVSPYIPDAAREERGREEEMEEARAALEALAVEARKEEVETTVELIEAHDPATGIFALRERVGADLIAMSTRGRGGVARLVLGSTADKVIRGARVPVLVHRTGERDDTGGD